ncbi:hypothetical protein B0I27_111100 [Arcticibacter pallidicorallinus]|uniref:Uncharacterized protein n=1 Tax=Arcticibacter pallidicorallinus TaxID=1259464 RepID=A0A2T0TV27_9SPHI|nr:hypothetical protein B0I27_111100 [Arcticibacter pallidicorallinus]
MDLARVFFFWDFKMIYKKTTFLFPPQEFRLILYVISAQNWGWMVKQVADHSWAAEATS